MHRGGPNMTDFWKGLLETEEPNDSDVLLIPLKQDGGERVDSAENDSTINVDETPLHRAVEDGNADELKELLSNDSYVDYINVLDSEGRTPLHIAVEKNDMACLMILTDNKNTDINTQSSRKGTAAFLAAELQHVECLNELSRNMGAVLGPDGVYETDANAARMHNAITSGQHDRLREEVDRYKSTNDISEIINRWDKTGRTLVHLAVEKNDVVALRMLIENRADIDRTNIIGGTPAYIAAYKGHRECLVELIRHRCDVNLSDIYGESPAYVAALNGNRISFDILMKNGADINESAYLAALRDHQTCLMFLIDRGADLSYVSDKGDTIVDAFFNNISEPSKCMIDILNSKVNVTEIDNRVIYNLNFKLFTKNEKQMQVISCLLETMNGDEEAEILNHPICEMYLHIKMKATVYRCLSIAVLAFWYIYFGSVFVYTGSLTESVASTHLNRSTLRNVLMGFLFVRFIFGIFGILRTKRHTSWWDVSRALTHVVSIVLVAVLIVQDFRNKDRTTSNDTGDWFLVLTDVVLVVHYIEYIIIHMRFRLIGNYYVMFLAVLQKTVIALLSFSFLIFSFVIIFQRQFSYYNEFANIFRSTLKTIVLMAGELEYENTFNGELTLNPNAGHVDVNVRKRLLMPRIMYIVFIIFIHISLLNLMTGLAVEHVADAKKRGRAISLKQQAQFLARSEEFLILLKNKSPYEVLRRWARLLLQKTYTNTTYHLERTRRPLVSQKLFDSLNVIARSHKQKTKGPAGTRMESSFYYATTL